MLPPVFSLNISSRNYTLHDASIDFVSSIFSKVFKEMYKSSRSQNTLIPESPAERWFNEMILEEYTRKVVKYNLKPLVKQIEKAFGASRTNLSQPHGRSISDHLSSATHNG